MFPEPMTSEQFTRLCLTGGILFVGATVAVLCMALGAATVRQERAPFPQPDKLCEARYLGEIAYWAEAPDNTMVCQRMDRNSLRERKCAEASVGRQL